MGPDSAAAAVGYVLQEVGLFPHMTVADNVGVVPRLEGWATDRVEARVARAARAGRTPVRASPTAGPTSCPAANVSGSASPARLQPIPRPADGRAVRRARSDHAPSCRRSFAASSSGSARRSSSSRTTWTRRCALADRIGVLDGGRLDLVRRPAHDSSDDPGSARADAPSMRVTVGASAGGRRERRPPLLARASAGAGDAARAARAARRAVDGGRQWRSACRSASSRRAGRG